VEKERIADSRLKIQSVVKSLKHVDPKKVHNFEAVQECLDDADHTLGGALQKSEGE
jgi:hypothetical protein